MSDPRIQVRAATLALSDSAKRMEVAKKIDEALWQSFEQWPMPISSEPTQNEVRRRFEILFEGYKVLLNEERFSHQRAIDYFPRILKAALDLDSSALQGNRRRNTWFATGEV
ncbi:MAG: hypothetical protein E6R03_03870 [Hyphomicrobiaceae bacterium]|nr:MAG: hypothetical protein E6R03_03870 [Hyphomicrobiaceae bacterium]